MAVAEQAVPRHAGLARRTARLFAALGIGAAASMVASGVAGAAGAATIELSSTAATASQVTYTIGFTSPGALSAASGTITLSGPAGTAFSSDNCNYSLYDATSTRTGSCPTVTLGSGGTSVTIRTTITVAAGNPLVVTVEGVANPTAEGADSLTVTTSAGGTLHAPYTLTAPTNVGNLSLTTSSTSATATDVTEVLSFTAANGMTGGRSQIVVTGPSGTTFSATGCKYALHDTSSEQTSGCPPVTVTSGNTVTVTPQIDTSPNSPLRLTIEDLSNPGTPGSDTVELRTTSDPVQASVPLLITAPTAVSKLSLTRSAKGASATAVTDEVSFVPSNALTADVSQVTLTAPTGVAFPADSCDYTVYNVSSKQASGCLGVQVTPAGNGVTITTGTSVAGGAETIVTVKGTSNPPTEQTGSFTVSTSSDPTPVSVADDTAAATAVKSLSITAGAHTVSATGVTYTAAFTSTSAMTSGFSQVTLTGPAGTTFPAASCGVYIIEDITTSASNGCLSATVSTNVVTITLGVTVNAGNHVVVLANDVTSSSSKGSHPVALSTTSDTVKVSKSLSLTAPAKVQDYQFSSDDASAGALRATYTLTFTATDGLDRAFGRIDVTVPAGVRLPNAGCGVYVVTDDTTEQTNGCLSVTVSGTSASVQAGETVAPGDEVTLVIHKTDNPKSAGKDTVKLSTSSDAVVASAAFQVKAETPLRDVTLTPSSYAAGATHVSYKITFVVAGSLTANTSTITITPTSGTTPATFTTPTTPTDNGCRITNGNVTSGTSWACASGTSTGTSTSTGTTTSFTVTPDESASTGNGFYIIINNVKNPKKAGTAVFTLHSSFDPKPVKVTVHFTPPTGVQNLTFHASSGAATATQVTYSAAFTAVNGLTTSFSTITLTAPAGAVLPASGCNNYVVTDATIGVTSGCLTVKVSGSTAVIKAPIDIRPGDAVDVEVNGVTNPASAGSDTVSLATSSDLVVQSVPFVVTSPTKVSHASLTVTGAAAPYKATLTFTVENGLTSGYSTVTVAAPTGAVLPGNGCAYTFTDVTDGQPGNCQAVQLSNDGATAVLTLPLDVRAGDVLQVVFGTVTGTKPSKASIATSSDPVSVST